MSTRFAMAVLLGHAALAGHLLAAEAAKETPALATEMAGYKLKNRSSYNTPETARPPFWPIGWQKRTSSPTAEPEVVIPKITLDAEQFNLTSVLLGSRPLAVINGRAYAEGETIRMPRGKDGAPDAKAAAIPAGVKIRVAKITDGTVTLEVNGQYTVVEMRRPQLSNHKVNDEEADLLKPLSER